MSEIVKCDVCGRVYNRRYLHTHKRLSHGKKNWASLAKNDRDRLQAIASLYEELSDENKERARERLSRRSA
jgi:hypothetical protein